MSLFFEEFSRFVEQLITVPGSLVILGDMNFHMDSSNDGTQLHASRFMDILETFDLKQHINVATHQKIWI